MLTNKLYNGIKYTITIFLPAVGALYFLLAQTWNFNRVPGVNGTINALITFGGLLIGYSTRQYNKNGAGTDGDLIAQMDPNDGTKYLGLAVNGDSVDAVLAKDKVTLQVVDKTGDTDARMPAPQIPTVIPGTGNTMNPATNRDA
jgi:hypothetical protein